MADANGLADAFLSRMHPLDPMRVKIFALNELHPVDEFKRLPKELLLVDGKLKFVSDRANNLLWQTGDE